MKTFIFKLDVDENVKTAVMLASSSECTRAYYGNCPQIWRYNILTKSECSIQQNNLACLLGTVSILYYVTIINIMEL